MKKLLTLSLGLLLIPSLVPSKSFLICDRNLMNRMTTDVSVAKKLFNRIKNTVGTSHAHPRRELFKKIRNFENIFQCDFTAEQKGILGNMVNNIVSDEENLATIEEWKKIKKTISEKTEKLKFNELEKHSKDLGQLLQDINNFMKDFNLRFKAHRSHAKKQNDDVVLANLQLSTLIIESFITKINNRKDNLGKKCYHKAKDITENIAKNAVNGFKKMFFKSEKEKAMDGVTNLGKEYVKNFQNVVNNGCKNVIKTIDATGKAFKKI